jgi:hypothetical protein
MSKPDWKHLDVQIQKFSSFLRDELKLDAEQSNRFATAVSQDLENLKPELKKALKSSSVIPIKDRLDELIAFQGWMDASLKVNNPGVTRARVITQNYICFVYLGESCFSILKKNLPSGSPTRKACQFLTDNPIRAFRNAIAHANWKYKADYSGIEFWARKGSDANESMVKWEVNQTALGFWQALSRTVAYVTFTSLLET